MAGFVALALCPPIKDMARADHGVMLVDGWGAPRTVWVNPEQIVMIEDQDGGAVLHIGAMTWHSPGWTAQDLAALLYEPDGDEILGDSAPAPPPHSEDRRAGRPAGRSK